MHPILAVGFRPFYLLAALFAVAALPLWMGFYFDLIPAGGYLVGISWHTHEMLFGFTPAVIAGFLLTAVQNWTGRPTSTGSGLLALVVLWLLARVLILTGPPAFAAVVDLLFLPTLAVVVGIPIARSGNYRNLLVLAVLVGLWLANLVFHFAHLNIVSPF
ncbi:MAG: NnrS family protein, partial [Gammaproteobacteria bacterium]